MSIFSRVQDSQRFITVLLLLVFGCFFSFSLIGQHEVRFGIRQSNQANPREITAVAYTNYTSNNVTISTALYTLLLPAGTATIPSIPPAPGAAPFVSITGSWTAQLINATNYSSVGFDPADLEGYDVYQVVLQNSPSPNVIAGVPLNLFRLTLPNDCAAGDVKVLVNDSPIQQRIFATLGANFNNQMSMSVNDAPSIDIYAGNNPLHASINCMLDDAPIANDDVSDQLPNTTQEIFILENDIFRNNGFRDNSLQVVEGPENGVVVRKNNNTPLDPFDDYFEYTPETDFIGNDEFSYQICDFDDDCDIAVVRLAVRIPPTINNTPTIDQANLSTFKEVQIDFCPVISDIDSFDLLTISVCGGPEHGTLTQTGNCFSYLPEKGFIGEDVFCLRVCDLFGACSQKDVSVNVLEPPGCELVFSEGPFVECVTNSTFRLYGKLAGSVLPQTGKLTLSESGGNELELTPPFPSTIEFEFSGLISDGTTRTFRAEFTDEDSCFVETTFQALSPGPCNGIVTGVVFEDFNGNGLRDVEDIGLDGIEVEIYRENGVLLTSVNTTSGGSFTLFAVPAGNYFLKYKPSNVYEFVEANFSSIELGSKVTNQNGIGTTDIFFVTNGGLIEYQNAGLYRCATIGQKIWQDLNNNDILDGPDVGVTDARVYLWKVQSNDSAELIDSTLSVIEQGDNFGSFEFCVAPGRYFLSVNEPVANLVAVLPFSGNDILVDSDISDDFGLGTTQEFLLRSGDVRLDFGIGLAEKASLGSLIWEDTNGNGVKNDGEPGIEGVLVELFSLSGEKIFSTISDEKGLYSFPAVRKGSYYLAFNVPPGYIATQPFAGSDPNLDSDVDGSFGLNTTKVIELMPGINAININGGFTFGVLPVTWGKISAKFDPIRKGNLVEWQTFSEIQNAGFKVLRKAPGDSNFQVIGDVPSISDGQGVREYAFLDQKVDKDGIYFYQILQQDLDGTESLSPVVSARVLGENDQKITLSPNPAVIAAYVNMNYSPTEGSVQAEIFDLQGRKVWSKVMTPTDFEQGLGFRIPVQGMAPQVYSLRVQGSFGSKSFKLVVVE